MKQPANEFFCPIMFTVLLEPYLTQCCGNHLSQAAYERLRLQRCSCPLCRNKNLTAMKDKFHERKVMSLKVRCPHKAEGCEWEGELGSLERHLNTNSSARAGECGYVDVVCPYACGERVQRRSLEEHKSQRCPLRPFTCQYCNYRATHLKATNEHWPVCEKYPLPCPNDCGAKEIKRQLLKGHLEQFCPLEKIECEFSYAGCGARLQRRFVSAHMKEGMEAHLSLVAQVSKKVPQLEKTVQQQAGQIKQQGDQIKQQTDQIKQQRDQVKQQADQIKQLGDLIRKDWVYIKQDRDQIKRQGDQIKQQGDQICALMKLQLDITMNKFEKHRKKGDMWYSPPFYSHVGGYKMCLKVCANGYGNGRSTHVSVGVNLMRGEFDDRLKWPFNGSITVKLKKQTKPGPPFSRNVLDIDEFVTDAAVCKPTEERNTECWGCAKYISQRELYAGGYLKNESLFFCVDDIKVESK